MLCAAKDILMIRGFDNAVYAATRFWIFNFSPSGYQSVRLLARTKAQLMRLRNG